MWIFEYLYQNDEYLAKPYRPGRRGGDVHAAKNVDHSHDYRDEDENGGDGVANEQRGDDEHGDQTERDVHEELFVDISVSFEHDNA